jgi:hypothetical protein
MVDINNQQAYSFIALVTAGLVMMLGISIVVVVHRLLSPMHPEKILLRSMHRFLTGSARVIANFQLRSARQQRRNRKRRKRVFETAILPVSAQLLHIEKNLDYPLFPDNTPEKVHHLVDTLQSVRLRLQALEASYTTAASESPELLRHVGALNEKWRERIQMLFEKWARLEQTDVLINEWHTQPSLSQELEQRLDSLQQDSKLDEFDEQALRNIYALIGSTRSLLEAMQELGDSMQQINWNQWAVARF